MNLEHLIKLIKNNQHKLKNKKFTLDFLRYHIKLLNWKKNKLKLGAIIFEIKETYFNGILLYEEIDIRYIKQDNTKTDELKLENRLKAIGWKWDFKNIVSFIIVVLGILFEIYSLINKWYHKHLPTIAYRSEHYDYLLKFSFESSLALSNLSSFDQLILSNFWLTNTLTDFCLYFNIIF
jgi:hypothetical protein